MKYIFSLFIFSFTIFALADDSEVYIGPFEATGFTYPPTNVYDLVTNSTNLFKQMGLNVKPKPHLFSNNGYIQDDSIPENCPYPPAWAPGTINHHPEVMNIVSYYTFTKWGKKFVNFGTDYPYGNVVRFGNSDQCLTNSPSCNINLIESFEFIYDGYTKSGASAEGYDPLKNASSFTIMAWVYRTKEQSYSSDFADRIVADLNGTTWGQGFQLRFGGDDYNKQYLCLFVNPGDKSTGQVFAKSDGNEKLAINANEWVHIAVTYDKNRSVDVGSSTYYGTATFFVNGVQLKDGSIPPANRPSRFGINGTGSFVNPENVKSNNTPFTIGCSSGADSYAAQFIGFIDDVILFKDWVADAETVDYWMNATDDKHRQMDIDDGIKFGTFPLSKYLYSAEQVTNLVHISNPIILIPEDVLDYAVDFGQFNPTNEIYGCDEVDNLIEDK